MEDYNTATMPHMKYYNYEEWEVDEYRRQQQEEQLKKQQEHTSSSSFIFHDEETRRLERKRMKEMEEQKAFDIVLKQVALDNTKREDMKRQAELQEELKQAHKRGDKDTVKRLSRLLAPDEPTIAVKHPWASSR
jgi:uncharacterized protein with NRDE domain